MVRLGPPPVEPDAMQRLFCTCAPVRDYTGPEVARVGVFGHGADDRPILTEHHRGAWDLARRISHAARATAARRARAARSERTTAGLRSTRTDFDASTSTEDFDVAYIICEPCIGTKDTACVDVCPVDCIHPRKDEGDFESADSSSSIRTSASTAAPACRPARSRRSSRWTKCRKSGRATST